MACFLNVGVDNQVTWPKEKTTFGFEGYEIVLLPKTRENAASAHVDLDKNRLTIEQAMTVINRFLSVMAWCDDQFAVNQEGWSGNIVPCPVPKRDLAFTTAYCWVFDRKIPKTSEARKAIAIYREALNATEGSLVGYAVLNFYKIIELKHKGRGDTKKWIKENYETVKNLDDMKEYVKRLDEARGDEAVHDYLYRACRTAVAHANKPFSLDADDFDVTRRFQIAASVLRELARQFISTELGVSDCMYDGT